MSTGTRLRHLAASVVERSTGESAPYIGLESIESHNGRLAVDTLPEKEATDSVVFRPGDVLFGKLRPYLAKSLVASEPGTGSGEILVLRPGPDLNPRFLHYVTLSRSWLQWAELNSYGSKMPRASWEELRDFRLPALDIPTQRAIADFLDQETAQIDAMVDAQERLVALLEERREAAVTTAVTTGAVDIQSEPSASSWYPKVPSGWNLARVSTVLSVLTDGAHISPDTTDGVYDFVSTRDVQQGRIDFEGSLKTSAETYEYMVRTGCRPLPGDVLFSKDGTVGRTAVVSENRDFAVASSLIIARPRNEVVTSRFLNYALQSRNFQEQALAFVRGAGLPRISVSNFGKSLTLVPPLDEQVQIVDHLDAATARIDTMIAKAQESIALMRERRAAVISAAVTGRIDVRTGIEQVERDLEEARV